MQHLRKHVVACNDVRRGPVGPRAQVPRNQPPPWRRSAPTKSTVADTVRVAGRSTGTVAKDIARLVGHSVAGVPGRVYRHQLQAVLDEGTTAMDGTLPLGDAG